MLTLSGRYAHCPRRPRPNGWTLQEALIVVAILLVLMSLAMPTFTNVQELVRRTKCQSNVRGFVNICVVFATSKSSTTDRATFQQLPVGRIDDPADLGDQDNYVRFNSDTYVQLRDRYELSQDLATCMSVANTNSISDGDWRFDTAADSMHLGLIYWGGRDDHTAVDPNDRDYDTWKWKDIHKREDPLGSGTWVEYTPTSNTLVTCMMYDVNANGNAESSGPESFSLMPHSGSRSKEYPGTEAPEDYSVGIAVGFVEGDARWVKFDRLEPLMQYQNVWYAPY